MPESHAVADSAQDQNPPIDTENIVENDVLDHLVGHMTPEQEALASQNIGLVGMHIRNNVPTPYQPKRKREFEDLYQEGCLALVRAAIRYNKDKDGDFVAYALPRIRGAVYQAIHDKFSIIHVPFRTMIKLVQNPDDTILDPLRRPIIDLNNNLPIEARKEACSQQKNETVRHMIRQRFELAVSKALIDIQSRKWRRTDLADIMLQIANERLLISRESNKTARRQIALNYGLSTSRASNYERRLMDKIKQNLQKDVQVKILIRIANREPDGFNTVLDDQQYEQLSRAEIDQFTQRFEKMKKPEQARLLYSLIERSAENITEIA